MGLKVKYELDVLQCKHVTISVMCVDIEWKSISYMTLGAGIIVGLEEVSPRLTLPYSKMYFVAVWSSFALGLYMLTRNHDRTLLGEPQAFCVSLYFQLEKRDALRFR